MINKSFLPILLILPTFLISCPPIVINIENEGVKVSSSPSSINSSMPIKTPEPISTQINSPENGIGAEPLIGVNPSSTATQLSTPVPTPDATATPKVEDTYTLYKSEVEVSLGGFKPDGIHGGEPERESFNFKGNPSELKLPPYDPLVGLEELKEGKVVVNWFYDSNWNYKTSGGWTPVPSTVKDGDIIPVEEYVTLHSRVGPFVEGNVNSRVHFGGSNYYYLVTGDGEYGKDPNVIWYNNSTGEGTKIGTTIRNVIDQKLKIKGHDEFAINISYSFGARGYVGWWYYYKK